jgi:intein/homing endonuclease
MDRFWLPDVARSSAPVDAAAVAEAMKLAPKPLRERWEQIGGSADDPNAAWRTDWEVRRQMVSVGLQHGAMAVSYGGDGATAEIEKVDTARLVIAALQNFTAAAGFAMTALRIKTQFLLRVRKDRGKAIADDYIEFVDGGKGFLGVHAPKNFQFIQAARAFDQKFGWVSKQGRPKETIKFEYIDTDTGEVTTGSFVRDPFFRFFRIKHLGEVVNTLQAVFGDVYCKNPQGKMVLLPTMALEPEVLPEAPPIEKPKATNEPVREPDKVFDKIKRGDTIKLPDGSSGKVQYVNWKSKQIAVGADATPEEPKPPWVWHSFQEIETVNAKAIHDRKAAEEKKEAKAAGEPVTAPAPEPPPPPEVSTGTTTDADEREIPIAAGGRQAMPHQVVGIRFIDQRRRCIVADDMGLGKGLFEDEPVLVVNGDGAPEWRPIKNVEVGQRVASPAGGTATVVGVYPQGLRPTFRVTFSDGTSVLADDEHRWRVDDRTRGHHDRVMTTAELREAGLLAKPSKLGWAHSKFFLPSHEPVDGLPLPEGEVDPYVLGIILGDGSMRGGSVHVTNPQEKILAAVSAKYACSVSTATSNRCLTYTVFDMMPSMKRLGLAGKLAQDKFIPPHYLSASIDERKALLAGLLDTDGECSKDGTVIYSTASARLAEDVTYLARSLGGVCSTSVKKEPYYMHRGERGLPSHRLNIRINFNPFRNNELRRDRWKNPLRIRAFKSIEPVGDMPTVCLAVDGDAKLYFTKDFIPTHNTMQAVVTLDPPALLVVPASLRYNWVQEVGMWRPDLTACAIEGGKPPDEKTIRSSQVFIVSYDSLGKHLGWLGKLGLQTVVADEAHYLKELQTTWDDNAKKWLPLGKSPARASAFYVIQQGVPKVVMMTGTPVMNRVREIWPLLHMTDYPDSRQKNWTSRKNFCLRYCAGHVENIPGVGQHFNCDGRSNIEELHERILLVPNAPMIRRTKAILNLPPKARISEAVALSDEGRKKYCRIRNDFMRWVMESGGPKAVERAMKAQALVQMTKLRGAAAYGKVPAVAAWVKRHFIETGERPLIVAGLFTEAMEALGAEIDKMNVEYEAQKRAGEDPDIVRPIAWDTFMGGMTDAQRKKKVQDFQAGKIDVLIYSIALGVGTTLTRATEMVFMERAWRPADLIQMEDRCIEEGQLVHTRHRGFIPIEEVTVGDQVLTHKNRWRSVTRVSKKGSHRELMTEIAYKRYSRPLRSTHDHKLFALCKGASAPEWIEAHRLLPGDFVVAPRLLESSEPLAFVEPPDSCRLDKGRMVKLPARIPVDDELLFFWGWYLAAGFSATEEGKGSFVSLAGHTRERPILERLGAWFERLGINYSIYEREGENGLELRAFCHELAAWMREWFGHGAQNKSMPDIVMSLPPEQAKVLLEAYIMGDGYRRKQQTEWVSTSKTLCSQMALLAMKCGKSPGLREVDNEYNGGQWVGGYTDGGAHLSQYLKADDRYVYHPISSVTTSVAKRTKAVYDLTVEDDHSFVVGLAAVHNCHRIGQSNAVTITYLDALGTIDMKLALMLKDKTDTIVGVLDGDYVDEDNAAKRVFGEMFYDPALDNLCQNPGFGPMQWNPAQTDWWDPL